MCGQLPFLNLNNTGQILISVRIYPERDSFERETPLSIGALGAWLRSRENRPQDSKGMRDNIILRSNTNVRNSGMVLLFDSKMYAPLTDV